MLTEIITHPVNSTTIALIDVTLTCSASVDDVTYSWDRIGGSLPLQSQGQDSNRFTINRATPHDEGVYYCVAKKSGIRVESTNALVIINGKNCMCKVNFTVVQDSSSLLYEGMLFQKLKILSMLAIYKFDCSLYIS